MTEGGRAPAETAADLAREVEAQRAEVEAIHESVDPDLLVRRPPSGKWSAVEHVDHLVKVNRRYADAIEAALRRGREKGRTGSGPFRGSWLGRRFAGAMEPPVKMKVKTVSAMQPDPDLSPHSTLKAFADVQDRLVALLRDAEGLDLDRIRTSSPFARILRAPVFSWFCVLSAHNRRHIWLMRGTLEGLEGAS